MREPAVRGVRAEEVAGAHDEDADAVRGRLRAAAPSRRGSRPCASRDAAGCPRSARKRVRAEVVDRAGQHDPRARRRAPRRSCCRASAARACPSRGSPAGSPRGRSRSRPAPRRARPARSSHRPGSTRARAACAQRLRHPESVRARASPAGATSARPCRRYRPSRRERGSCVLHAFNDAPSTA